MRIRAGRALVGVFALAGLATIPSLLMARPKVLTIPLLFRSPAPPASIDLTDARSLLLKVDEFTDTRTEPQKIGENLEEKEPVPVTTKSNVGAFCADTIAKILRDAGVKISVESELVRTLESLRAARTELERLLETTKQEGRRAQITQAMTENNRRTAETSALMKATHILKGEVRQFFVTETGTYDGAVTLRLSVLRASDSQVLHEGIFRGTSKRWGRSLKDENYQECLSESLFEAARHLMEERGFLNVLQ